MNNALPNFHTQLHADAAIIHDDEASDAGENMDDNADATEVITQTVETLRLAGINDTAIASSLVARGLLMRLMGGASAEGVLGEVEDMLTSLAENITGRS